MKQFIFLLFSILYACASTSPLILANRPVEPEGLTEPQAAALLRVLLLDKGYTSEQIDAADIESVANGPNELPFAPDYYSFHVSYDSPNQQAISTWGNFLVNKKNGDILEMDTCAPYKYADLETLQVQIRNITHSKKTSKEQLQEQFGCE